MTITETNTTPIVGHRIRFDVIGPHLYHPLACQAMRKAPNCPYQEALNQHPPRGYLHRGEILHAVIEPDGAIHCARIGSSPLPHSAAAEITALLDAFADEVGDQRVAVSVVTDWIGRVGPRRRQIRDGAPERTL